MAQIQQKVRFWIALIKTFRMMCNLFGFTEVRTLSLFLVMTSIMTSFVITGISS